MAGRDEAINELAEAIDNWTSGAFNPGLSQVEWLLDNYADVVLRALGGERSVNGSAVIWNFGEVA